MRADIEKIVGPAAVDERPVRDMWPLAIMRQRAGEAAPRALVAKPTGRQHVAALLRWATANRVAVTPMGGGSGVCGALSPAAALTGDAGDGPIVCVISGGNIDLKKFAELIGVA